MAQVIMDGEHRGHHAGKHVGAIAERVRARRAAHQAHAEALAAERALLDQEIADGGRGADPEPGR